MHDKTLARFIRDDEAATAIEYALIVAMIAVAMVTALMNVGSALQSDLNSVVTGFQSAK